MVNRDWPPLGRIAFIARHWPNQTGNRKGERELKEGLAGDEIRRFGVNEVKTPRSCYKNLREE